MSLQAPTAAPNASIRSQSTDRADLLAFEIEAKIEKPDMEWMARRVETAFAVIDVVDMIIIMRNYDGAELSAVFDGEALKSMADANRHVRRYAVVGAPIWAKAMINMFSPLTPVKTKTFKLEDEADAWAWVNSPSKS